MRITLCVDALTPNLSGIGRYCFELANRLASDPRIERLQFLHGARWISRPELLLDAAPAHVRRTRLRRKIDNALLRYSIRQSLVHGPNYFLPPHAAGGVITVHDLSVFRYPETHPQERVKDFERRFTASVERAGHIITDSKTVRDELISFAGLRPGRVTTVHLGVSPNFRPRSLEECRPFLQKYHLDYRSYALCVSAFEPRKRIHELMTAWRMLPKALRQHYPLALVGAPGWQNETLIGDIETARAEGWLKMLGYVSERDLPFLYAGAALFAYPSIYEGFGLPPVEAMACGTPAIVSDRSCLPEITGGCALMVDPDDVAALSQACARGLTDDIWRTQAIDAGGVLAARLYLGALCR